jgi:hypothetical protein
MIDVTDIERTMQEDYEADCLDYHQWFLEQRENEERALAEQSLNDRASIANLLYHCCGGEPIPPQPVTHRREVAA